jgi:hypothetical protein
MSGSNRVDVPGKSVEDPRSVLRGLFDNMSAPRNFGLMNFGLIRRDSSAKNFSASLRGKGFVLTGCFK